MLTRHNEDRVFLGLPVAFHTDRRHTRTQDYNLGFIVMSKRYNVISPGSLTTYKN